MDADQTLINSETVMNGVVKQGGGSMSLNGIVMHTHKHGGVKPGGDRSEDPQ